MKKTTLTTLLALLAINLNAATFLYDDLTTGYANANLVGQNGWAQTSTASNNPIQYFDGKVVVGSTGQDVWKSFSTQVVRSSISTVYTRINFSVVNTQNAGDYFFSLSDPSGTASNFYQRLFARTSGSGFNLGLQSTSGTGAITIWGTSVYNLNDLLNVVIAWDIVPGTLNDTFSVYVNPLTNDRSLLTAEIASNWNSTTGPEPALNISALNLRQGTASTAPTVYVDELWVGNSLSDVGVIPEPDSWLLLLVGLSVLGFMKTKNKTKISLLAALLAIFSLNTTNAAVLGIENGSNYTSGTWIEGASSSVGTWYFLNDTSAFSQIADSTQGGRTSIGADAFNFVPGNTGWNQFANGWYVLNGGGLLAGQTLSVDANYLWNGGNRGVEFMSGNTAVFRMQQVWSDAISFAGTGITQTEVLANAYQQALTYSVDQIDQLTVQVSAYLYGNANTLFTQTVVVPDVITGIHFYAGDIQTTVNDQPNYGLFVNNIEVSGIPEPSAGSLLLLGGLGVLAIRTLKRKELNA